MATDRRPHPLPSSLRDGPFRTADALTLGATPAALRHPSLRAPTSGVRLPAHLPDDLVTRCSAIALALADDAVFSHGTALRLLGVDRPWLLDQDDAIHVVLPRAAARPSRAGVVAHWSTRAVDVTRHAALRVTSPVQTWVHLAATLSQDEVVVLADAMMRRGAPLVSPDHFARTVHALPAGTRGIARMRRALELMRPRTDSCMETRARLHLVLVGLPCPAVNEPALARDGSFLALPDLSYPELKIAIEYDGDVHRTDPATWRRDVERRQRLEDNGWLIITATSDDVLHHPGRLIGRVRRAVHVRRRVLAESGRFVAYEPV